MKRHQIVSTVLTLSGGVCYVVAPPFAFDDRSWLAAGLLILGFLLATIGLTYADPTSRPVWRWPFRGRS